MISVLPAQAGIQEIWEANWMPACTGRTEIHGFVAVFMQNGIRPCSLLLDEHFFALFPDGR
jgi:hypothetical protein